MGLTKQRLGSVLNSAQSSANNWQFHKFLLVKNYLKESLLPIFCLIIQVKGFSVKGLMLNSLNTPGKFIYRVAFLTRSVI